MLGGFDPNSDKLFFQRRRGRALLAAVALYAAALAYGLTRERSDAIVEVGLEPELTDFAVEEEEPPKEEEPPPPPPPDAKVQVTSKPKPKPKLKPPPAKPQEVAPETTQEKTYEVGPGGTTPGGTGTGPDKPKAPPKPKVEAPKPKVEAPKPKKPEAEPIDPTKPIDRPENATAAKPDPGNAAPKYPESLRDEGITGEIVLKLHIHRDGTVRGAKVLRKKSTAATDEAREAAEKLFLAAAIAAVKTWKFTPSTVAGEPISVWQQATIPFSLTGG
ncbi:MAG: energy transducer TonB [Nannocystaceae bacterium]|jgi:protein TonB